MYQSKKVNWRYRYVPVAWRYPDWGMVIEGACCGANFGKLVPDDESYQTLTDLPKETQYELRLKKI